VRKQNILVAGGAGFIGSNLALKLIEKGYVVTVLDNLSTQVHGTRRDSPLYRSIKGRVRFINGDVRHRSDWIKALEGQNIVVHLAAETGTGQSMYEIEKYIDVNVRGTAILLDILANETHNVNKVVVASSRAIYGEGKYKCRKHDVVYPFERQDRYMSKGDFEPKCPVCHETAAMLPTDEESKLHPSSVYGITKQNQEQMVMNICGSLGIPAVSLRYQNVFGPGQSLLNPYTGILSIFSTRMMNNNEINVFEDGFESRDFIYIDDVIRATILAIEKNEADGEVFNVGSGVATTVLEIAKVLKELYCSDVDISVTGDYRLGDIRHNVADLRKVEMKLAFTPGVEFKEGIQRFAEWVGTQDIHVDFYEKSITEMKTRGLLNRQ